MLMSGAAEAPVETERASSLSPCPAKLFRSPDIDVNESVLRYGRDVNINLRNCKRLMLTLI